MDMKLQFQECAGDLNTGDLITCCYANLTKLVQVVRIANVSGCYLEKVIFPGQQLQFTTLPEAWMEVYTGPMMSAMLADKIACRLLQII